MTRAPGSMRVRELRPDEPFSFAEISRGKNFVYLLHAGPFVKIGISNNVEVRAATIQIGFPYRLSIVKRWKTPFAREIEGAAHELLESYRQNGEWFTLPPRVATILLNILVDRRPRTRPAKKFTCKSILFCSSCGEHNPINTTANFNKTYVCRRCDGEMMKFNLNVSAKVFHQ